MAKQRKERKNLSSASDYPFTCILVLARTEEKEDGFRKEAVYCPPMTATAARPRTAWLTALRALGPVGVGATELEVEVGAALLEGVCEDEVLLVVGATELLVEVEEGGGGGGEDELVLLLQVVVGSGSGLQVVVGSGGGLQVVVGVGVGVLVLVVLVVVGAGC